MMCRTDSAFLSFVIGMGLAIHCPQVRGAEATVDFNREVRPILSGKCFACHGPDEPSRKAGLRLDLREAAVRPTASEAVPIAPGKPDQSDVIDRVETDDPDAIMPPPSTHKTLNDAEKATLRRWVAQGAKYEEHWAFRKPVPPVPEKVRESGWVRNPIDTFILARLEREGLKPSPEASRTTLIRRLSLDLIGLPPTPAEVDAFEADTAPDAYERLVDRLLASPHYGERWARRWLDRARYADSNGYEKDRTRSIWPFRDWVIRALNADQPFDQFTIDQIAGDMLPEATEAQKVATGFHRNTQINEEGGIDVEEFRFASVVDRVATTGSTWLGLTIQCAQCHTHKFDPITQREYYQFFAFLNNADEPDLNLARPTIEAQRSATLAEIDRLETSLADQFPVESPWEVLKPTAATAADPAVTLTPQADGSLLASGSPPATAHYEVTTETALTDLAELRLEALPDSSLPGGGPGRAVNGNFVLTGLKVQASPRSGVGEPVPLAFDLATADFNQGGFDARGAIDGDPATGWAVDDGSGHLNRNRTVTFHLKGHAGFPGGTRLVVTLDQAFGAAHTLGRFRLSTRANLAELSPEARQLHIAEKQTAWEASLTPVKWTVLTPSMVESQKHATMTVQPDGSVRATGDKPNNDTYTLELPTDLKGITSLRLDALTDPEMPEGGPGRSPIFTGDFLLTRVDLSASTGGDSGPGTPVPLVAASADFAAAGRDASMAIDDKVDTGWSVGGAVGKPHEAIFRLGGPVGDGKGTRLTLTLHQDSIHQTTLGHFRISATNDPAPARATGLPPEVEASLLTPVTQRPVEAASLVTKFYLAVASELSGARQRIADLRASLPKFPTSMVMKERSPEHARVTQIHKRGEFLQPTLPVEPGLPAALPPLPPGTKVDRLALARWLVSGENPLVGRVLMNQAWQAFFGRGIVGTLDDFGTRGEEPSHPQLLDWLATEWPRRGWSVKAMHRLIVNSATYRQTSAATPELLERDPRNDLLARGPRFRVEAEMVRDLALTASGLLTAEVGGPSVYPPQPDGVMALSYAQDAWPTSNGPERFRRGLYTFLKRTAPYAAFMTFDAPTSEATCTRRERSNTPLQALTLLNDTVYLEASRALARRVANEVPGDNFEAKVRLAYRLCLSRTPGAEELILLSGFFDRQRTRFQADSTAAGKVAGVDPKSTPPDDLAGRAAWTVVARAILNLDETITKE